MSWAGTPDAQMMKMCPNFSSYLLLTWTGFSTKGGFLCVGVGFRVQGLGFRA
jgi:hypothetical protein